MHPTRNNRGIAQENGSIESRHGHFGTRLDQALQLRGSRDFATLADYRAFVAQTVGQHNAWHRDALRIEAPHLLPLPPRRSCDHDEATVHVTSSSGFSLGKVFYTVPSRLIGRTVNARSSTTASSLFSPAGISRRCRAGGRPREPGRQGACDQLPPCHPQPSEDAGRAGRPRLSRSALPAFGVSSVLGSP
ncbi:MAG: hypothetical protein H5U17_09270 [Defluviimonas sp.]|nr:hypothetical protein [Defluviimonas sp.]